MFNTKNIKEHKTFGGGSALFFPHELLIVMQDANILSGQYPKQGQNAIFVNWIYTCDV